MRLSQHEQERLLVHVAADVARARQARGPVSYTHLTLPTNSRV